MGTKNWHGFGAAWTHTAVEHDEFELNATVIAGSTLLRTVGTIELFESSNFPHFPPDEPMAVAAGIFQHVNTDSAGGAPGASDSDGEWLWWQQVTFTPGFGVTTAVQSDLVWYGSFYFDSKARRRALVDNPAIVISFAGVGDIIDTPWTRGYRPCSGKFTFRQLWEEP